MVELTEEIRRGIDALAADRQSGASGILRKAVVLLRTTLETGGDVVTAAAGIVAAQPSMAPVWNAAIEAVASRTAPERLERFSLRADRSAAALVRYAVTCFPDVGAPLRVVTLSSSQSVEIVCQALNRDRPVSVSCAESRPALEGRSLASRLAASGIAAALYTDAAIAHALPGAHALMLGADAVAANAFLNKSGSRMAVAAAAESGVPVYVLATRDKFAGDLVARRLAIREGAADEVWDAPPAAVSVRNPYFEWTPLDLVTAVVTDVGVLGAGIVPDVCRSMEDAAARQAIELIAGPLR